MMATVKKTILSAIAAIGIAVLILVLLWIGNTMRIDKKNPVVLPALSSVSPETWQSLAGKKIFFAHMSVGFNLLEGLQAVLNEHSEIQLNIIETANPAAMDTPALYHTTLGFNGQPMQKIDSFKELISAVQSAKPDIAMMKLCYVDIYATADIEAILAHYQKTIDALQSAAPDIKLIHCTVPLTSEPLSAKGKCKDFVKRLIGRPETLADNAKRLEFNQELKKRYPAETIFDLAAIESLNPDGFLCCKFRRGQTVPFLCPAYTTDGGHLTVESSSRIAEQWLIFLSKIVR